MLLPKQWVAQGASRNIPHVIPPLTTHIAGHRLHTLPPSGATSLPQTNCGTTGHHPPEPSPTKTDARSSHHFTNSALLSVTTRRAARVALLSTDMASQHQVSRHNGHALSVKRTHVDVVEQPRYVVLCGRLHSFHGVAGEAHVEITRIRNLLHHTSKDRPWQNQWGVLEVRRVTGSRCPWGEALFRVGRTSRGCARRLGCALRSLPLPRGLAFLRTKLRRHRLSRHGQLGQAVLLGNGPLHALTLDACEVLAQLPLRALRAPHAKSNQKRGRAVNGD